MAKYGNTSVSSLLSAAQAARKKQESLEDSIAAYEFDLSNKTAEDYQKYVDHLSKRATTYQGQDPSRALEYQKKITAAQRSTASAEISRASTQVLYGNISNRQKYQVITNLYQQAVQNGDENLMQRLEAQAARLSVTIQNEEEAAANAARAAGDRASAAYKKQKDADIKSIERKIKATNDAFQRGDMSLDEYATTLGNEKGGYFKQKNDLLNQAINDPAFDSNEQNQYIDKLNSMYDSSEFKKFTGPALKQMAEQRPYAVRVDPFTGERTIEKRKQVGVNPGKPGDLQNIFSTPAVDTSKTKNGDVQYLDVARKLQADPTAPIENFQFGVFNSQNDGSALKDRLGGKEFNYYVDPITGRAIVYDPSQNAVRTPLDIAERNAEMEKKWKEDSKFKLGDVAVGLPGVGTTNLRGIGDWMTRNGITQQIEKFSNSLLGGLAGPVGNIAGTWGGWRNRIFGNYELQKKADELKAQVAAKQEQERQARAAEAARQAQEAQAALNASRNAAAAKPQYVAQNRTVQVQAPFDANYYIRQLPQPQRAQSAIQNVLQSPFRNNSRLPF